VREEGDEMEEAKEEEKKELQRSEFEEELKERNYDYNKLHLTEL